MNGFIPVTIDEALALWERREQEQEARPDMEVGFTLRDNFPIEIRTEMPGWERSGYVYNPYFPTDLADFLYTVCEQPLEQTIEMLHQERKVLADQIRRRNLQIKELRARLLK